MNSQSSFLVEEGFSLIDSEKKGAILSLAQIDNFLRRNGKVV